MCWRAESAMAVTNRAMTCTSPRSPLSAQDSWQMRVAGTKAELNFRSLP